MKPRHLLSLAALSSLVVNFGHSATEQTAQEKFDALKAKGIFAGMNDQSSGLNENMTRAQFARVAALISGLETDNAPQSSFHDVNTSSWAIDYVGAAYDASLPISGDGQFNPESDIRLEALMKIVVGHLTGFGDSSSHDQVEDASAWALGTLFVNADGKGGLLAATSDRVRYTAPDGTVIVINTGDGVFLNEDGSVVATTTLQALIDLEAKNGTAGNPGSLTSSLNTFVSGFADKVASGAYGDRGPTLLANVVATASQANPDGAASYVDAALGAVAGSTAMNAEQKKSSATVVTQKAVSAVPASDRTGLTREIHRTLTANSEGLGLSRSDIISIIISYTSATADSDTTSDNTSNDTEVESTYVELVSPSS